MGYRPDTGVYTGPIPPPSDMQALRNQKTVIEEQLKNLQESLKNIEKRLSELQEQE
jgi:prefoldin subunit 5